MAGISGELYFDIPVCFPQYAGVCFSYANPLRVSLCPSWLHIHLVSSACGQSIPKLFVLSPALLLTALFIFKVPHCRIRLAKAYQIHRKFLRLLDEASASVPWSAAKVSELFRRTALKTLNLVLVVCELN